MKTEEIHIMIGPHEPLELEFYISAGFFKDIFKLEIGPRQSLFILLCGQKSGGGTNSKGLTPPCLPSSDKPEFKKCWAVVNDNLQFLLQCFLSSLIKKHLDQTFRNFNPTMAF